MQLSADLVAPCPADDVFVWVDDLSRYESWMGLVHRAVPLEPAPDGLARWDVELRARIGPLARSKRLTMVRTECVANSSVVFERREVDGRKHSAWRLSANLMESAGPRCTLVMSLHYAGALWTGGVVDRVLHDEINRGRDRLLSLVAAPMP